MSLFVHYLPGGGLGDVFRESYYHNALGILKRWKLEHQEHTLRLFLMSHNPAAADFVAGQSWIDEVVARRFPLEKTWNWEAAYQLYAADFKDAQELRFAFYEHRSLYDHNKLRLRGRLGPVVMIEPMGCQWTPALSDAEWATVHAHAGRLVWHPFAGETNRDMTPEWRAAVTAELAPWPTLIIGADYERQHHGAETIPGAITATFPPRVLVEILRRSAGVIGTESSVYYMASMLGTPTFLTYGTGTAFHDVARGRPKWDWFFNTTDPRSAVAHMPERNFHRLNSWVAARAQEAGWRR
jgi:hypothetical protein